MKWAVQGSRYHPLSSQQAHVSRRRSRRRRIPPLSDAAEPDQVVCRERPGHSAAHFGRGHQRQFAQPADGLDPAEALLDAFADLQAHRIALATCGTSVDGAAPSLGVAGDVGLDVALLQCRDEVLCVIAFVRAERGTNLRASSRQQIQRTPVLASAAGVAHVHRHQQAVAILHQGIGQIAQLRFLALAFADQAHVRIGGGGVRVVAALVAVEVVTIITAAVSSSFGLLARC